MPLPLLQRLNPLLLSMLILSHVSLVWIPIVSLSHFLMRLNPAISGKVGVLRIFVRVFRPHGFVSILLVHIL